MKKVFIISTIILSAILLVSFIENSKDKTLRETFKDHFYIGTAVNGWQLSGRDDKGLELIKTQFSSITAENGMKFQSIHPEPEKFNFEFSDKLVQFGVDNNQFILGHTLAWHSQTPKWVFYKDSTLRTKDDLYKIMDDHISTVVGRYKGRVGGWDVVNEALNEDGTLRNSDYYKITDGDFIYKAFELAQKADPDAELYYNDYNMWNQDKVDGAVKLAKNVRAKGLKIDGIGMQGHWSLEFPSLELIESSINKITDAGLKVMITELDISVLPNPRNNEGAEITDRVEYDKKFNPYIETLPDSMQQKLAKRYEDIFKLFNKHKENITRVTLWGVTDSNSWKNNFPVRGRTDYPLLFGRDYQPKEAYYSVLKTVED